MRRCNQIATVKSVASRSCSYRLAEVSTFFSSGVNAVEPRRGLAERLELTFVQVAHRQELVLAVGHHPHPLDIGVAVFPLSDEVWQYWIKPMRKNALPEKTKS